MTTKRNRAMKEKSTELQMRIARECCLLYGGADSACWACGPGWDDPLEKLSYKLEALNVQLYDRWKVRVVAAQIKEKFGTLRFYFDCLVDGNGEPTREQVVLSRYAEDVASEYVRKAEEEGFPPVRYEMNGKFYEGDKEIPSPFKSKSERSK